MKVAGGAVLFDLDGTLVDTIDLIVHCFDDTLRHLTGRPWSREEIIALFGPTEPEIIRRFAAPARTRAKDPARDYESACERFFACYERNHDRMVHSFPGMADLIRTLADADVPLGLVTNKGRRTTETTLRLMGLRQSLAAVVTGDEASRPKPDPAGIVRALAELGVQPGLSYFVGDSEVDILAGKAAGVRTIAVGWGRVYPAGVLEAFEPDFFCNDFADLARVLLK